MKKVLSIMLAALMIMSVFSIAGYAVSYQAIDYISIQGVVTPVVGAKPTYSANANNAETFRIYDDYNGISDGYTNVNSGIQWYDVTADSVMGKNDTFQAGHSYSVMVFLTNIGSNNMFPLNSSSINMSINGIPAEGDYIVPSSSPWSNGYRVWLVFPPLAETIKSIAVTGVTAPEIGAKPVFSASVDTNAPYSITEAYDYNNTKNGVQWYDLNESKTLTANDTFVKNHTYSVTVFLRAKEDYAFPYIFDGSITVNNKEAAGYFADPELMTDYAQDYMVIYVFPALSEDFVFPDVAKTDWYYDAVQYCAKQEFITGYKNGKFGPADPLQRQDFVVILARIAGANLSLYKSCSLSDVAMDSYYGPSVAWAVSEHIITGYNNGKFGVGDKITREQVATILYRYLGSPAAGSSNIINGFPDRARISEFADNAMIWAVNKGIISGKKDGTLAPTATASRAEIATIIMRMDQKGMF
ncbi:MAG: S-layer homology domain-containing protein [Clostridiaceae bacterium]|nr:S-layer homology domain-containing protein [Clostridiaceae bacterium]